MQLFRKKPLDKLKNLCYNKGTVKKRQPDIQARMVTKSTVFLSYFFAIDFTVQFGTLAPVANHHKHKAKQNKNEREVIKMARVPMVTRTIKSTKVNVLLMNVNTKTPEEREIIVPRTYDKEKQLFKAIDTVLNDSNLKVCAVISTEVVETLYGMSEFAFIANAKPISKKEAENAAE